MQHFSEDVRSRPEAALRCSLPDDSFRRKAEVQQWLLCSRSVLGKNPRDSAAPASPLSTWVWITIVIAEFVHYVHLALTVEQGKP